MRSSPIPFNPFDTTLEKGVNLIEASAGTGKTYSIAMLVVRFVVEQGIGIENILVVTFTKAATAELKERIRSRLIEVRQAIVSDQSADPKLLQWLENLDDAETALKRINSALSMMDYASIFTIHGFAQRVLKRYALESGQLFDVELQESLSQIKQTIVEDYWRLHTYECSDVQAQLFLQVAKTPSVLLAQVEEIPKRASIQPKVQALDSLLADLNQQVQQLGDINEKLLTPLIRLFDQSPHFFKKTGTPKLQSAVYALSKAWLDTGQLALAWIALCSSEKISQCFLKKHHDEAIDALAANGAELGIFDDLVPLIQAGRISILQSAHHYVSEQLEERLKQARIMSFDQMIERLAQLMGIAGQSFLRDTLSRDYPVALIDEFQDTDHDQWLIFRTLFANEQSFLYLIGDPKQAIYSFRGADIHTYLLAQASADRQYTLDTNWRSHKNLIEATNLFFGESDAPFLEKKIAFHPVNAAITEDCLFDENGHSMHQLCAWELGTREDGKHWKVAEANAIFRLHVVNEILRLVDGSHYVGDVGQQRNVSPADIAILVRSKEDAKFYQQTLLEAGLPVITNTRESVFLSQEAHQLHAVLKAIANPTDVSLASYAICLPWFGVGMEEYVGDYLTNNQLDDWMLSLQLYHEKWLRQGVLSTLKKLIHDYQVHQHLAVYTNAERRITNIQHLLELTQQQVMEAQLSMSQVLRWFGEMIMLGEESPEKELRLESDKQAIKIVTMHSSKGLEYPIVFCPVSWKRIKPRAGLSKAHIDDELICDLGSEQHAEIKGRMLEETRQEAMRLFYVAVTRAKYRCYVLYADERTQKDANNSPIAHLLNAYKGSEYKEKWLDFQSKSPSSIHYRQLGERVSFEKAYSHDNEVSTYQYRSKRREMDSDWALSSYSALAAHEHSTSVPEIPLDKADEEQVVNDDLETVVDELPRGAHTGNVIHELLERQSFQKISNRDFDEEYQDLKVLLCTRYGLNLDEPNASLIDDMLVNTVSSRLSESGEFTLARLNDSQCLKEMPFYFKVEGLETRQLNDVLSDSAAFHELPEKQLRGQMTGFIDLICEYQGQYYVMDYKTNALDTYDNESMTQAMHEHNYGLQYWLYALVLHRHLQHHLPDYDFARHFGGVRYLFVRGMQADKPMQGVYQDKPSLQKLEQLAAVLNRELVV